MDVVFYSRHEKRYKKGFSGIESHCRVDCWELHILSTYYVLNIKWFAFVGQNYQRLEKARQFGILFLFLNSPLQDIIKQIVEVIRWSICYPESSYRPPSDQDSGLPGAFWSAKTSPTAQTAESNKILVTAELPRAQLESLWPTTASPPWSSPKKQHLFDSTTEESVLPLKKNKNQQPE